MRERGRPIFNSFADIGEAIVSSLPFKKLFSMSKDEEVSRHYYTFGAGNIRFGLELKEGDKDRGVIIHVLANDNDSEQDIKLLSFDCSKKSPHGQDICIWLQQPATAENGLRWTLNQLKFPKLRDTIEQAGFPEVAATLDNEAVQSVLPELEEKAFTIEKENER
jgi:hypothetical protein